MALTKNPNKSLAAMLHSAVSQHPNKGQDDSVPAVVQGPDGQPQAPAALSPGEFVVPADVVSMLGDGDSQAGSEILQKMIDSIRVGKTGKKGQPPMMQDALSNLLGSKS